MDDRAVEALRTLMLAGDAYRHAVAAYHRLGVTETLAISYLTQDGDLGQSELAARLNLTTGAVTALVDRLERADVARRRSHATDRRRSVITLTDKGRKVVEESRRWLLATFDDVRDGDLDKTVNSLETVARRLRQQAETVAGMPGSR